MIKSFTKNISDFLHAQQGSLQSVLFKCKQLDKLNTQFLTLLDENLRKYCVVANTNNRCLILLVANGSVATQIRFITPNLLSRFKSDPFLQRFQEIECKVRPTDGFGRYSSKPAQPMKALSVETIEMVEDMAESLSDPKLKEIMKKIAKSAQTKLQPK